MTTVVRRATNPVSEMLDWLEGSAPWGPMGEARYIRVEDFVDENTFVVRDELPGVDPDKDIEVAVVGDVLTIRGERREEERDRNHSEFHYGSFSRSVRLPRGATSDDVSATYGDGVLEVRLPMQDRRAGGHQGARAAAAVRDRLSVRDRRHRRPDRGRGAPGGSGPPPPVLDHRDQRGDDPHGAAQHHHREQHPYDERPRRRRRQVEGEDLPDPDGRDADPP